MSEDPQCKKTRSGRHTNLSGDIYGGYCFDCHCFGVPEMEAEIERGRKALAYLADLRSKLASIGIPTKELDAILRG